MSLKNKTTVKQKYSSLRYLNLVSIKQSYSLHFGGGSAGGMMVVETQVPSTFHKAEWWIYPKDYRLYAEGYRQKPKRS